MTRGTIVFVHGTGVRLRDYHRGFEHAKTVAATAGISGSFLKCAWGDPFGVESGQPFPDSHSTYFGNDATWRAIRGFVRP